MHTLAVAANGTLSEPSSSPASLPSNIPAGDAPQGVAVIPAHGPGSPTAHPSFTLRGSRLGLAVALYESGLNHRTG